MWDQTEQPWQKCVWGTTSDRTEAAVAKCFVGEEPGDLTYSPVLVQAVREVLPIPRGVRKINDNTEFNSQAYSASFQLPS